MGLQLYDLAGAEPKRRFSPYCWRIKLSLMHRVWRSIPSRGDLPTRMRLHSPDKAACRC